MDGERVQREQVGEREMRVWEEEREIGSGSERERKWGERVETEREGEGESL